MRAPFQGNPLRVTFDDVISGEKAPLGRILRNFRLRMGTPFQWNPLRENSAGNREKVREKIRECAENTSGHVTPVSSGYACARDHFR
jgi:hypothetical protein